MLSDPAAMERAERAVGQLAHHVSELKDKQVKLTSRIKMDAAELKEIDSLIAIMEETNRKTLAEKDQKEFTARELKYLAADVKTEEKALVVHSKSALHHVNVESNRSSNRFALAQKEGLRGYSSGPGTTCTRTEVREREKRAKLLRIERMVKSR